MTETTPLKADELQRFRLDGRVAIVTGGTGGIGSRVCQALGRVGAQIVVHGRDEARTQALAAELREEGIAAIAVLGDLTRRADADRLVDEATAAFSRVDVIVNTVGGGAGTRPATPPRPIPRRSGTASSISTSVRRCCPPRRRYGR